MSNISEYLVQMQNLTKKNLEILKGINHAFYTKADHLNVSVDNEEYTIPSFLSLESKINSLQDNFENLVNAPKTGEATFDFNGNTQSIELKGFSNTPAPAFDKIEVNQYTDFDHFKNQLFKDFCTPQPFVKIDLSTLPADIQRVNVKKITFTNKQLIDQFKNILGSNTSVMCSYKDVIISLYNYTKDVDYTEVDKIYDLPIRGNVGVGNYKINNVIKNWTDNDLDEHYTLVLDSVYYYTQNETIQNTIKPGDFLVTSNDIVKLKVEDVKISTKTIDVRVVNGGYADLVAYDTNNDNGLGELKYLPQQDWSSYKYVNIPLNDDQYVMIFIAPIQRVSHIQSAWNTGILFNIYNLKCDIDGITYYFKDYYHKFVNDLGNTLIGITDMFDKSLEGVSGEKFDEFINIKPTIDISGLKVLEINKHLNNSSTISEIYDLYNQKQQDKNSLIDVQKQIDQINSLLSSISFQDTTQNRNIYEQQLISLNAQKTSLNSSIENAIKQISRAATDTDTPIDNPKYHIRGFYDYTSIDDMFKEDDIRVVGIDVQYRYKNANQSTGNATTIGETDIFSDWNQMISPINKRRVKYEGSILGYSYEYEKNTTNINEISFNQIDIPISQGESVDIRLRVIYNIGQPICEVVSQWSNIVNIEFPNELKRKVSVLDIINENNIDIENNQFESILNRKGVNSHVEDKIIDQNTTFFHSPEHIASGFYTAERRIIPLADQLKTMSSTLQELRDEIYGNETNNITVTISDNVYNTQLIPYSKNIHTVPSYTDLDGEDGECKYVFLNLNIQNTSKRVVKLYSIFPGTPLNSLTPLSQTKFNVKDYVNKGKSGNTCAVYFVDTTNANNYNETKLPSLNQVLYFRLRDVYDGAYYYNDSGSGDNKLHWDQQVAIPPTSAGQATLFPTFKKNSSSKSSSVISTLCIPANEVGSYKILQPGETLSVPLLFSCILSSEKGKSNIEKTMSFDICTSLYKDPINYTYTIHADYADSISSKLQKVTQKGKYNPVVTSTKTINTAAQSIANAIFKSPSVAITSSF